MNALTIVTRSKPDCLERILQRIRHRGFTIKQFSMEPTTQSTFQVQLKVEGARSIENLESQLRKLHDVMHVNAVSAKRGETPYAQSA